MTTDLLQWATESLAATAGLILLVLFIRKPVARYFGPNFAYALWAIPALRAFMPPIAIYPAPQSEVAPIILSNPEQLAPALQTAEPVVLSSAILSLALGIWLSGALLFTLWNVGVYKRFTKSVFEHAQPAPEALQAQLRNLTKQSTRLILSSKVQGPVTFGLLRPVIALPMDFEQRYSSDEQLFALRHELAHIKGRDLWLNTAALLIRALHWPNPLVHFAMRAFHADQEMACDHRVLKWEPLSGRKAYGSTLLKTIQQAQSITVCPLNSTHYLKERLHMLDKRYLKPGQRLIGGLLVTSLGLAGLALSATYVAADEHKKETKIIKKQVEIITDGDQEFAFLGDGEHKKIMRFGGDMEFMSDIDCDVNEVILEEKTENDESHKEHMVFCIKTEDGTASSDPEAIRKAIAALKEEDKRASERRKKTIKRLEERLKEIEKK